MQDEPRLYVAPEPEFPLIPDRLLTMSDGQAHYLGHVLRRSVGDTVRLFNGHDGEWQASIETLRKDRGSFRVRAPRRPALPETGPVLVFAPLKRDATDLVVRMATELGVSALLPVTTARTNTARVNRDRWVAIATEAAEQCERLTVPEIAEPVRFNDLLGSWPPGVRCWRRSSGWPCARAIRQPPCLPPSAAGGRPIPPSNPAC